MAEMAQVSTSAEVDSKQEPARRRRWPEAVKRRMVAETLQPGASVSVVARRHDVNANQLFAWRRQHREGMLGGECGATSPALLPVSVAVSEPPQPEVPIGSLEVRFPSGAVVRVSGRVEGTTLRQVFELLSAR